MHFQFVMSVLRCEHNVSVGAPAVGIDTVSQDFWRKTFGLAVKMPLRSPASQTTMPGFKT